MPKVTWWQSGSLFDSSDEVTRTGVILNRMVYKSLTREDLGKTFTCQAANTNLTMPVSAEVKIIINRKLDIKKDFMHVFMNEVFGISVLRKKLHIIWIVFSTSNSH